MINVLLATEASLDHGGITVFMLQWIRGIKRVSKESNVHVYFRDSIQAADLADEYKDAGAYIHTGDIHGVVSFKSPSVRKKVSADIKKILIKEKINILHINSGIYGFQILLLSEARRLGVPIRISHSHGSNPEKIWDKPIHFFMIPRIRVLATKYAGCSKRAGIYLFGNKGVYSEKWHFIPNTIQSEKYKFDQIKRKQKREELGIEDDELLLGAVGRLDTGKNHIFLVNLISSLTRQKIKAKLLVIGEGEQRKNLLDKSKKLNIEDKVLFYGESNDVPGWLSAMDYYCMPSLSEGLPISAIEAQANGLTCLLSDRISQEVDIIDNVFHLSIDTGTNPWTEVIHQSKPADVVTRKNAVTVVREKGFDEADTCRYVAELYGI